jgi:hypothetical protein
MLFFPCRVYASDFEEAQRLVISTLAKHGLKPAGPLRPRPCPVQPAAELIWWECYAQVE